MSRWASWKMCVAAMTVCCVVISCTSGGVRNPGDSPNLGDTRIAGDDGGTGLSTFPRQGLYTDLVDTVTIEVDYETGAAPYTGTEIGFGRIWSLFEANVDAVFSENVPSITIDTELADMEEVTPTEGPDYTATEILAVADRHRDGTSTLSDRTFYIVFLDGYFEDGSGRRENVLGVSLGSTEVIAMFKPVIDATSLPKRVEQVTLVHEFGHAVGLVNNGVPMEQSHQDAENGAHCTQTDCVMYWTVSGGNVVDYILSNLGGNQDVLFGPLCAADMVAASP